MRKLDILITCHNEGAEVVKPLLDSIALQRGVDLDEVGVIICCDGGTTVLTDEFLSQYPYHTEFHMCKHAGVSATRNKCLDLSRAEYVMWADCDDALVDTRGLHLVFREMSHAPSQAELAQCGVSAKDAGVGFDYLISSFVEESKNLDTGEINYLTHNGLENMVFIHGQVFNRQWLVDNDIRFDPALTVHEDHRFICLARELVKPYRARVCPYCWYAWCWNSNSVCRRDPLYLQKTYVDMIAANTSLVDEFTRRGMADKAMAYAVMMIEQTFYTLCKRSWRTVNNEEYRQNVLDCFKEYYVRNRDKWHSMPEQEKMMIAQSVSGRCLMEGDMLEAPITIRQWLVRLGLEDESYIKDSLTYI